MSGVRVALTTFGFPLYQHAFLEDHAVGVASHGVGVGVVSNAPGDHAVPDGLDVVRAPFADPPAGKLRTLGGVLRRARAHNPEELTALVRALRRTSGVRHLPDRLYAMAPVLAADADVVHVGWLSAATRWTPLVESIERPIVVSSHGSDLRLEPYGDETYRANLRRVFDRVDLVHCVSADLARRAEAFGLDPAKGFVSAWGVDTGFFTPPTERSVRTGPLRVVSVGRVHWVKAYETALQSLAGVRRGGVDVEYTIVGEPDPKATASVLAAVDELGLDGCVHLRGLATRDGVRDALRAADVFLLTSVSEGLSTATVEAMATGLPVVVTDVGGMREAVDDDVTGVVVPPREPAAVTDALLALARDPDRAHSMGSAARRRAVERFDLSVRVPAFVERYRRLAAA